MIGLIASDLHIYPYSQFAKVNDNGENSRLGECLSVLEAFVLEASKPEYEFVLLPGDLFNEKDKVNVRAFTEAVIILSQIEKPCLMVTGNHDFVSRRRGTVGYSASTIFSEVRENFHLDENVIVGGVEFVCVPYFENTAKHMEEIRLRAPEPGRVVLVTHAEVRGSVDHGHTFETGLPRDFLESFRAAIVGHIHTPQLWGTVLVPGSPLHHDFGDVGRNAFIWKMELGAYFEYAPIELPGPRFYDVKAEDWSPAMALPSRYFRISGELEEKPENAIIVPVVVESASSGRGDVSLEDSREELLKKWLGFKGMTEESEVYLPYGEACLAEPTSEV